MKTPNKLLLHALLPCGALLIYTLLPKSIPPDTLLLGILSLWILHTLSLCTKTLVGLKSPNKPETPS